MSRKDILRVAEGKSGTWSKKINPFGATTLENCFATFTKAEDVTMDDQVIPGEIYQHAHKGNITNSSSSCTCLKLETA